MGLSSDSGVVGCQSQVMSLPISGDLGRDKPEPNTRPSSQPIIVTRLPKDYHASLPFYAQWLSQSNQPGQDPGPNPKVLFTITANRYLKLQRPAPFVEPPPDLAQEPESVPVQPVILPTECNENPEEGELKRMVATYNQQTPKSTKAKKKPKKDSIVADTLSTHQESTQPKVDSPLVEEAKPPLANGFISKKPAPESPEISKPQIEESKAPSRSVSDTNKSTPHIEAPSQALPPFDIKTCDKPKSETVGPSKLVPPILEPKPKTEKPKASTHLIPTETKPISSELKTEAHQKPTNVRSEIIVNSKLPQNSSSVDAQPKPKVLQSKEPTRISETNPKFDSAQSVVSSKLAPPITEPKPNTEKPNATTYPIPTAAKPIPLEPKIEAQQKLTNVQSQINSKLPQNASVDVQPTPKATQSRESTQISIPEAKPKSESASPSTAPVPEDKPKRTEKPKEKALPIPTASKPISSEPKTESQQKPLSARSEIIVNSKLPQNSSSSVNVQPKPKALQSKELTSTRISEAKPKSESVQSVVPSKLAAPILEPKPKTEKPEISILPMPTAVNPISLEPKTESQQKLTNVPSEIIVNSKLPQNSSSSVDVQPKPKALQSKELTSTRISISEAKPKSEFGSSVGSKLPAPIPDPEPKIVKPKEKVLSLPIPTASKPLPSEPKTESQHKLKQVLSEIKSLAKLPGSIESQLSEESETLVESNQTKVKSEVPFDKSPSLTNGSIAPKNSIKDQSNPSLDAKSASDTYRNFFQGIIRSSSEERSSSASPVEMKPVSPMPLAQPNLSITSKPEVSKSSKPDQSPTTQIVSSNVPQVPKQVPSVPESTVKQESHQGPSDLTRETANLLAVSLVSQAESDKIKSMLALKVEGPSKDHVSKLSSPVEAMKSTSSPSPKAEAQVQSVFQEFQKLSFKHAPSTSSMSSEESSSQIASPTAQVSASPVSGPNHFTIPYRPQPQYQPQNNRHLFKQIELANYRRVQAKFRSDLLCTSHPISTIYEQYKNNNAFKSTLTNMITQYFTYLGDRFKDAKVNHLNLVDVKQYIHDDFGAYGERFLDFVANSSMFLPSARKMYHESIKRYIELFPSKLLNLRAKLLNMMLEESAKASNDSKDVDMKKTSVKLDMITYKVVNPVILHSEIKSLYWRKQVAHFISRVELTGNEQRQNLDRFVECLSLALGGTQSALAELKPKLYQFGSLSNGLGAFDSDLDLVVKLEAALGVDLLDFETAILALEVMKKVLFRRLGIAVNVEDNQIKIVRSRRCPIVQLDFEQCFPEMKSQIAQNPSLSYNKCDISISSLYGVHNSALLRFLTSFQPRFYRMTLLLKYWAKQNELIHTEAFSSYAFTLMILFYCQVMDVLPSVSKLQTLAREPKSRKEPIKIHRYNFEFCDDPKFIGAAKNRESREQDLIVGFFEFYYNFDYSNHAISPRLGKLVKKEVLYAEKSQSDLSFATSLICIEDPFVLDHNVGSIFRYDRGNWHLWMGALNRMLEKAKVRAETVVTAMTDPRHFNRHNPPFQLPHEKMIFGGQVAAAGATAGTSKYVNNSADQTNLK